MEAQPNVVNNFPDAISLIILFKFGFISQIIYFMSLKLYYIQVEGIRCTNCAGKIKNALTN